MNLNDKEWMKNELEKFIVENDSLHKRIKELEEEKQWLYGKLNIISDIIEKGRTGKR